MWSHDDWEFCYTLHSNLVHSAVCFFRMFRSAFWQLLCLVWPLLSAGLFHECNFNGTGQVNQNLSSSSSSILLSQQLPASRVNSHSCIVTAAQGDSFLRVKANALGEVSGKSLLFSMKAIVMMFEINLCVTRIKDFQNSFACVSARVKAHFYKLLYLSEKRFLLI